MRSRLWSMIIKELPFPFRQIGMEIARIFQWVDDTGAGFLGWIRVSRGWSVVCLAGIATVSLTLLLFFPHFANHDPTLYRLAIDGQNDRSSTNRIFHSQDQWAEQDHWRVAHMFVDSRPVLRHLGPRLDSRLIDDDFLNSDPTLNHDHWKYAYQSLRGKRGRSSRVISFFGLHDLEPDVRLELQVPGRAEQSQRVISSTDVREPGSDFPSKHFAARYDIRDPRLLVQAEWEFNPECFNNFEPPRAPITRRIEPIPEPQWDEPEHDPVPRPRAKPDLSFAMTLLREYFPSTGEFPPRSKPVEVSAHSEMSKLPTDGILNDFDTTRRGLWKEMSERYRHLALPESYSSRIQQDSKDVEKEPVPDYSERPPHLRSFAEVALRLEMREQSSGVTGKQQNSSLVVVNEGSDSVSLVRARESLSELQTVTNALPDGHLAGDQLTRDVRDLPSGQRRELNLEWVPDEIGS
ncbi:MAG: hypothetical protein FJ267_11955, partial [Planctomycetes bacterium]|nr:hypothetical protein [Planctomycetota bacterium]